MPPSSLLPKGGLICHASGHVLELKEPHEYDMKYKEWKLELLPVIPEQYQYKVVPTKAKLFQNIKKTLLDPRVAEICLACDAAREGELIGMSIILMSGVRDKPIKRLWISDLTKKEIIRGFLSLRDIKDTYPLYLEARARQISDWTVGICLSRATKILLEEKRIIQKKTPVSIGRVQTPLLIAMANKERDIEEFESKPFWTIEAEFMTEGNVSYWGKWSDRDEDRFYEKSEAESVIKRCENQSSTIRKIEKERKNFKPPKLFNLSGIQIAANKMFHFSPEHTLSICQRLYDKGHLSYPRTSDTKITEGEANNLPVILSQLQQWEEYKEYFPLPRNTLIGLSRYVGDVSDHYALIPTTNIPSTLDKEEKQIYDLVVRRVIAAHYEDAIFDYTKVETSVIDKEIFVTKGKQMFQEGWRKVIPMQEDSDEIIPPELKEGENGVVQKIDLKESQTKPPQRFTGASLIAFMCTAGSSLDIDEKEVNLSSLQLGTEATRAGIIKTLEDRGFIEWKKGKGYLTPLGMIVASSVNPESVISSALMTAKWEAKLSEIGQGKYSADVFIEQAKKLTVKLLSDTIEFSKKWNFEKFVNQAKEEKTVATCPKCGGSIVEKKGNKKFYGCSNYSTNGCTFSIPLMLANRTINKTQAKKLIEEGITDTIKNFQTKQTKFDAKLKLNGETGKVEFVKSEKELLGECPACKNEIIELTKFYGCSNYKNGCKFSIPKEISSKRITKKHVRQLCDNTETEIIEGMLSKNGNTFSARLRWEPREEKVKLHW